jgi:YHS domain-containing protein
MKDRRSATLFLFALLALSVFAFGQKRTRTPRATDPVCGLSVEKDPQLSATYHGQTFYFCSNRDRDTFRKNPAKYVK